MPQEPRAVVVSRTSNPGQRSMYSHTCIAEPACTISSRSRVSIWRIAGFAVGLFLGAPIQTVVHAQGNTSNGVDVQVMPAVILVNPKTHTVTFQLINLDSVGYEIATLKIQDTAPRRAPASGDSLRADSLTTDSVATRWSLAGWVHDSTMTLAPREHRTVTLSVTVPTRLPKGTYSAYVLVTSAQIDGGGDGSAGGFTIVNENSGNGPGEPFHGSAARLVYHARH